MHADPCRLVAGDVAVSGANQRRRKVNSFIRGVARSLAGSNPARQSGGVRPEQTPGHAATSFDQISRNQILMLPYLE